MLVCSFVSTLPPLPHPTPNQTGRDGLVPRRQTINPVYFKSFTVTLSSLRGLTSALFSSITCCVWFSSKCWRQCCDTYKIILVCTVPFCDVMGNVCCLSKTSPYSALISNCLGIFKVRGQRHTGPTRLPSSSEALDIQSGFRQRWARMEPRTPLCVRHSLMAVWLLTLDHTAFLSPAKVESAGGGEFRHAPRPFVTRHEKTRLPMQFWEKMRF